MAHSKEPIRVHGPFQATDRKGLYWNVVALTLDAEGYIPDLRVQLDGTYDEPLYDDEVFIGQVMARLRAVGFTGEAFDRAELGMQGKDFLMLEPSRDFREFAVTLGWSDLSKTDGKPWGDYPAPRGAEHMRGEEHTYVFRLAFANGERFKEDQDYKTYSGWMDALEGALDQNIRKISGWSFTDRDNIECEAFTLCQPESTQAGEGPHGEYRYLDYEVPIKRDGGTTLTPVEVRQFAEQLTAIVTPVAEKLGFTCVLSEVRYYRRHEFSTTGLMFRHGPDA